jgi:hypothetical protein
MICRGSFGDETWAILAHAHPHAHAHAHAHRMIIEEMLAALYES